MPETANASKTAMLSLTPTKVRGTCTIQNHETPSIRTGALRGVSFAEGADRSRRRSGQRRRSTSRTRHCLGTILGSGRHERGEQEMLDTREDQKQTQTQSSDDDELRSQVR